jgi:TolA-binding protein
MADMGRIERDDNEERHLPETLGTATEGLRSTVELEVAKIVETAEARAAEIEDQALERASRVEQNSQRRLEVAFQDSRQRLEHMLSRIDAVERSLGEAVGSLRAEAEQLTGELNGASTESFSMDEPMPPASEAAPKDASSTPPGTPEPKIDPEIREMIRLQLVSLAEAGRTRADAERMLLRFSHGEQYFDLLDEIYPQSTPGRRGLLRRRKAKD